MTTRSGAGRGLLGNSVALLAMAHVTSVLGYLFWMACARGVSASAIGMASTVISAMSLVAILAAAGFVPLLTRALSGADPKERSGLCSTALVLTAVGSGLGGAFGALLLPERVHAAMSSSWLIGLLGAGSVGTAVLLVVNAALLGVRRAELSLLGSAAASMSRLLAILALLILGLLVAVTDTTAAYLILALWVASLALSFALSVSLLARAVPGFRFRPGLGWLRRLRQGVAWEHVATLGARVPDFAIPIMAAAHFPPAQVGYLSMTWMVSTAFFAVSSSVSSALLADCADRPERLRAQTRRALGLISALLIAPVAVTCLLASWVLGLFGTDYARHGSALLVLLLLCSLPNSVVNVAVAVLRLQNRLAAAAAVTVTGAAITLCGAWLLMPRLGITGAGWAMLASDTIMAGAMLAVAYRRGWVAYPTASGLAHRSPERPSPLPQSCPAPDAQKTRLDRDTDRMVMTLPVDIQGTEGQQRGLRILHATDSFLPNVGGLELSIAALVRAQVRHGRMVAVVAPPHPAAADREDLDGAKIYRLPMTMARVPGAYTDRTHLFFPPVPDPQFSRAFADLIRRFRPDVIHVRGWILYSVLGAARRAGVPVVATAHDHSQVCATKTMLYRGGGLCSGPGLLKCVGCAYTHYGPKGVPLAAGLHLLGSRRHPDVAHWMAISSALAARGSAPRPNDRRAIEVIPTFIDDDLLTLAADSRTANRPGFVPAAGPYLFYAGALGTHKGVDVLLDAHRRLAESGFDVPLVLAGLPRPDFRLPDRPGVTVVERVPHRQVIAAWRHAIVGIVPSVVPEGLGRVAVECLAAGTPCVVSAIGGLLDVVEDGVDGLHVPPGDAAALAAALRRLLEDEQLRLRLGAAGPTKAAHFALSQVLPRLDEVYQRVLDEAGAGRGSTQPSRIAPRAEAGETANPYEIEIIRTGDGLVGLQVEWRALYDSAAIRNPFLSYEWTSACREHLCPKASLFLVTARADGRLTGVAPLRLERHRTFRVLRFIGDGRSDYQGFLLSPRHQGVETALLQALENTREKWDLMVLRQLSDLHTTLHRADIPPALRGRDMPATISPCLSLAGGVETISRIAPASLRRGRRAARKFEREGGIVEVWTGPEAVRFIDDAANVEARSWKPNRWIRRFAEGPPRELLRQALGTLGATGEMELWLARMEGKPIAFLLNFRTPHEVWHYQGAFDEEYRKLYPSGVLHYRCIERACRDGLSVYDFLSGDEPYKHGWTNGARPLCYRALFPATIRGYLAYGVLLWPRWRLLNMNPVRVAAESIREVQSDIAALLKPRDRSRSRTRIHQTSFSAPKAVFSMAATGGEGKGHGDVNR